MKAATSHSDSRTRLLDAAIHLVRAQGYAATTVDDVCRATGLTKGAFFHHFKSKEDLALAAAAHFSAMAEEVFGAAPYRQLADPLDRLLGSMVQETYDTHPSIRQACDAYIGAHAADVARDIAAAKALYAPDATWS